MANAVYLKEGAVKTFKDSGGDVAMTLTGLANGAGRVSAQLDLGASPRPYLYEIRATMQFAAALAYGVTMSIFIVTSDGTLADAVKVGTADAAITVLDMLNNAHYVGALKADGTTDNDKQQGSWVVPIYGRYVNLAVWNAMGQALEAVGTYASYLSLRPLYDEVQ